MKNPPTINESFPIPSLPNYGLKNLLGEGGYGYVYEGEQFSTGQRVAIKMLKFAPELNEQQRKYQIARFERETHLCAELSHPHIVRLLDKGYTVENEPFAVFEYVEGVTLKELITTQEGLSPQVTGALMGQVLDALAAAHAKGIVHRDLKPHNIMVTRTGSSQHVKVLDFGIGAFTRDFRGHDYQSLTLTREVMGTPAYSAPEQLRGEPATVKSDIYAWALTTIECLTGQPVVQGDSVAEVFQQQLDAANIPLPPAVAGHSLADLLRRALHKNPRLRADKAVTLFEDFQRINFQSLVGPIAVAGVDTNGDNELTAANQLGWKGRQGEKRQISVLCVRLDLVLLDGAELDLEALDALQQDQLNHCKDVGIRFGGYIAGVLANHISIYFGYPQASDNDARRAGRAALEMLSQVRRRSALLEAQHRVRLQVRMSLHAGNVLARPNHSPQGLVPNAAFDLLYQAKSGNILVSVEGKALLDPFIEFEPGPVIPSAFSEQTEVSFYVKSERQTEALSYLRPYSANRQMIGRDSERTSLMDDWQTVQRNTGQAVVLHGQAGIGKSKMVYEIKQQVRADGHLFRECRCLPEHQNNALYPFLDMLRNHWGVSGLDAGAAFAMLEDRLGAAGVDLAGGLPILCSWLSIPLQGDYQVSQLTPDLQKKVLFQVLEKCILHIGRDKSFLLVLEDLHWLDPTGREFVEFLLSHLPEQPWLLLMTTRPVFVPEWEADALHHIHLQPLGEQSTEDLVRIVLDGKSIDDKALTYIRERADGIPLYLEELTRMLIEEGYLVLQEDIYQFGEDTDVKAIPNTLQDLLNARLDRLGLAKETAQIAGTIGREFRYAVLVSASLRDEASVQTDLDALMDADLIYRQRGVADDVYIFRHALIGDAAYDGMLNTARIANHGRIAQTYKDHFPEVVEETPFELARHLAGAEEYEEGVSYGIKAAKGSLDRSADQEVLEYTRMLDGWMGKLSEENQNHENQLNVHCMRTNALMNRLGWTSDEVQGAARKAYELLKEYGWEQFDTDIIIATYWVLYLPDHVGSRRDRLEGLTKEMYEIAELVTNTELKISARFLRGMHFFKTGQLDQGIELLKDVMAHLDEFGEQKPKFSIGLENFCWASSCLGQALWLNGEKEEGYHYVFLALERAKKLKHPGTLFLMHHYAALIYSWDGDKENTKRYAKEAIEIGEKYELHAYALYAKVVYAWATDDAEGLAEAIEILKANGCFLGMANWMAFQADYEFSFGDHEKGVSLLNECLTFCEETNERYYQGEIQKMKSAFLISN